LKLGGIQSAIRSREKSPLQKAGATGTRSLASSRIAATPGDIRIGISGWRYKGWRGVFYPKGLQQRREL
jgi:hypothetical protein